MTSADSDTGRDTGAADSTADSVDDDFAPEPDADDNIGEPARERRLPAVVLTVAVALLVAAVAVAGWFGVAWFRAANDDGLAYSKTRDEVDRVARAAVRTVNELDYRDLDAGLTNLADATTGSLHDEIANLTDGQKQQIKDAKLITTARVTASAVKELDDRGGKATVLVALEKSVATAGKEAKSGPLRTSATLQRTKDGWKLDGIGMVPFAQPR